MILTEEQPATILSRRKQAGQWRQAQHTAARRRSSSSQPATRGLLRSDFTRNRNPCPQTSTAPFLPHLATLGVPDRQTPTTAVILLGLPYTKHHSVFRVHLFFSQLCNTPSVTYIHTLLIHSSVDGCLGCFSAMAIANGAVRNTCVQMSLHNHLSVLWSITYPSRVRLKTLVSEGLLLCFCQQLDQSWQQQHTLITGPSRSSLVLLGSFHSDYPNGSERPSSHLQLVLLT